MRMSRSQSSRWPSSVANPLKIRTRRPSSTICGRLVLSHSNFALPSTLRAASSFTRRGSVTACRSFSRASRMAMVLRDRPRARSSSRTRDSVVTRTVSYRSRWSPSSVTRTGISVLGGSSRATSRFSRRRMNGRTRAASAARRPASPRFSMGVRYSSRKVFSSCSRPGARKLNCDHSSPRWFSSGVPVSASRCRAFSEPAALAAAVRAFLMFCASSRITRWYPNAPSSSMSRGSSG